MDSNIDFDNIKIYNSMPLVDLQEILKFFREEERSNGRFDVVRLLKDERDRDNRFSLIGSGHFSRVYSYLGYAIKFIGNKRSYDGYGDYMYIQEEVLDAHILNELQTCKAVPRLYSVIDNQIIIMEKIDGLTVKDFEKKVGDGETENFINPNFVDDFRKTVIEIMGLGYDLSDAHSENIMIEKSTGLARIIDVGLYRKCVKPVHGEIFIEDNSRVEHRFDSIVETLESFIEEASVDGLREYRQKIREEKVRYKARRKKALAGRGKARIDYLLQKEIDVCLVTNRSVYVKG